MNDASSVAASISRRSCGSWELITCILICFLGIVQGGHQALGAACQAAAWLPLSQSNGAWLRMLIYLSLKN